jgi:hypothetical protein
MFYFALSSIIAGKRFVGTIPAEPIPSYFAQSFLSFELRRDGSCEAVHESSTAKQNQL